MSRHLSELETSLQLLLVEHRILMECLDAQQKAMKSFDLAAMSEAATRQEPSRLRIAALEMRRRIALSNLAHELRVKEPLTLRQIAALLPPRARELLKVREELRSMINDVSQRTMVSGRLAGAVLGHLNTVFRLFASAAGKAGLYTKAGIPRLSGRIGVMEAIG